VGIFSNDQRRLGLRPQRIQHVVKELVPTCIHCEKLLRIDSKRRTDVEERSERVGWRDRVAGCPHDLGSCPDLLAKFVDERRLPNARLATDQDHATVTISNSPQVLGE
jgi:hypothetical protein